MGVNVQISDKRHGGDYVVSTKPCQSLCRSFRRTCLQEREKNKGSKGPSEGQKEKRLGFSFFRATKSRSIFFHSRLDVERSMFNSIDEIL